MFTGIIEAFGSIESIVKDQGNLNITIKSPISSELKVDQSVSHNGICLTVVDCNNKIINGHHRWTAAKSMGFEEMAVAKLPYKISTIVEKWSKKYKKSINCNNPKGFSQRAHCAGRKKK